MNCQLTGTARLGAEPELRFTPSGKAVCELRLAFSNSRKDPKTQEYIHTEPIWVGLTLWEAMAENAAESLNRGDELVVTGQLEMETYEKRDGTKGEKLVLKYGEVAPSIRRNQVTVRRAERGSDSRPAARSNGSGDPHTAHRPQARAQVVSEPPF